MVNLNFVHSAITSCAAGARSWSLLEANATITTTARPRIMGCLSIKLTKVIVSQNSAATTIAIAEAVRSKD